MREDETMAEMVSLSHPLYSIRFSFISPTTSQITSIGQPRGPSWTPLGPSSWTPSWALILDPLLGPLLDPSWAIVLDPLLGPSNTINDMKSDDIQLSGNLQN